MNNSLSFLYTAAVSRGIANSVMRNLRSLSRMHRRMPIVKEFPPKTYWKGQLSKTDEKYKPVIIPPRMGKTEMKHVELQKMQFQAWSPIGEIIRLAEGRDRILLGRVRSRLRPEFFRLTYARPRAAGSEVKMSAAQDVLHTKTRI